MRGGAPWIPFARIQELVTVEPGLVLAGLALVAWLIYKIGLRKVSPERHRNLTRSFSNLALHLAGGTALFILYLALLSSGPPSPGLSRVISYLGLVTLFSGMIVFVKTARILLFEYLFFLHMREAVPLLLVNLFTLALSLFLAGWVTTDIFGFQITPILATSAILSLVLGLALQDTLGNLFAGVALQLDKPYELGDWVEVQNGGQKWVGQVYEVSWRATVLVGFGDEYITIANRIIAQSQVSNFSAKDRPFVRSIVVRLPYGAPIAKAKEILLYSALSTPGVRKEPLPLVNITELNESWLMVKLIYSIDSYGRQYIIGDKIITTALDAFAKNDIEIAPQRILMMNPRPTLEPSHVAKA